MSFYTFMAKPCLYLCWVAKRVEPSEEGEREFITLIAAEETAYGYVLDLRRESKSSEEGEREFITLVAAD